MCVCFSYWTDASTRTFNGYLMVRTFWSFAFYGDVLFADDNRAPIHKQQITNLIISLAGRPEKLAVPVEFYVLNIQSAGIKRYC